MKKLKISRRRLFLASGGLVLVVSLCASVLLLGNPKIRAWLDPEFRTQVMRFGEALWLAETFYFDEDQLNYESLTDEAISGMANSLDSYSYYVPADSVNEFYGSVRSQYAGVGFRSRTIGGEKIVTRIFLGSPAKKAGLIRGERIVSIDGEPASELTNEEFSQRSRGPEGTNVTMEVKGRAGELRIVTFTRKKVTMPPVENYWVDSEGIGYIRIRRFPPNAEKHVGKVLSTMQKEGLRNLILDLRDNPGGDLSAVVNIAGYFVEPEKVILRSIGKAPQFDHIEWRSTDQGVFTDVPMVILVNKYSASGAEALSGALQAHNRAIIVGESSYGKGVAQQMFHAYGGAGLNLTTFKFLLPDDSSINGKGVTPDIPVPTPEKNLEIIRMQQEVLGLIDPDTYEKVFGFPRIEDIHIKKAIEVLKAGRKKSL